MSWMAPMRSTCCGISLSLMVTLLYVWMGRSTKSTAGAEKWWEPHADGRELGSSANFNMSSAPSTVESHSVCWIFVHLQKCGGATIKNILKARFRGIYRLYDTAHWIHGDDSTRAAAAEIMSGKPTIVAGGYTEGLRSVIRGSCKWLVIFRNPVARLVSAYYYCMSVPHDALCASTVVHTRHLSLEKFAEHWGNFGLRQFVLGMVSADDVNEFYRTEGKYEDAPGWYRLKQYLNHQGSLSGGDENTVMYEMLPDVRNLIHNQIDAVGLLEEFPTTLALFNKVLDMPHLDWESSFRRVGIHNEAKSGVDKGTMTLKDAWTNTAIKGYISLDLLLYEHAVDVFNEKAERLGLK